MSLRRLSSDNLIMASEITRKFSLRICEFTNLALEAEAPPAIIKMKNQAATRNDIIHTEIDHHI